MNVELVYLTLVGMNHFYSKIDSSDKNTIKVSKDSNQTKIQYKAVKTIDKD